MSEMVARVARALAEEDGYSWARLLTDPTDWRIDEYRKRAGSAIAAMREPTEAMMDGFRSASSEEWGAAIDAALKDR